MPLVVDQAKAAHSATDETPAKGVSLPALRLVFQDALVTAVSVQLGLQILTMGR